jgi:PqqD family protein of HPr-rel-A system
VFNTGSGDTHLLDSLSGEVLRILQQFPLSASELTVRVATTLGLEVEHVSLSRIDDLLAQFSALGLIESVQP